MEKKSPPTVQERPLEGSVIYRPDNSYLYFPKKDEEQHKDKRFVYYGQIEFTEKEKKFLAEYKKYLAAKKLSHTDYATDHKIVLFLHEKNFKVEDTYKALKQHEQWRVANKPILLTPEIQAILDSGIIYMTGRDHRYRPIVVMNLKLFDEKRTDIIIRTFSYFFDHLIDHVLLPGQVQQWVTIMDVEGFSLFSLPLGGGKKLLNHLETHYRGRLNKLYLVNSPSAVWISWKIVKQFLEDSTVEKVDIISNNNIKGLYKHTHLSQIEKKFGGTQENRKQFWPGERSAEQFLLPTDNHAQLHVTMQQYREMAKKLVHNIIHPNVGVQPTLGSLHQPEKFEVEKMKPKVLSEQLPKPKAPEPPKKPTQAASIQQIAESASQVSVKSSEPRIVIKPPSETSISTGAAIQEVHIPKTSRPPQTIPSEQTLQKSTEPKISVPPSDAKVEIHELPVIAPNVGIKVEATDPHVVQVNVVTHVPTVVVPPPPTVPPQEVPNPKEEKLDQVIIPTTASETLVHEKTSTPVIAPPPNPIPPTTQPNPKLDKIDAQHEHKAFAQSLKQVSQIAEKQEKLHATAPVVVQPPPPVPPVPQINPKSEKVDAQPEQSIRKIQTAAESNKQTESEEKSFNSS